MKFSIGFVALLLSTVTFASRESHLPMVESFYITKPSNEVFNLLKSRSELIIDHVKATGFELYGPKGLEEFLRVNSVNYKTLRPINQFRKSEYPTPEDIEQDLKSIAKKYPKITNLYSIGKSVNNRELWVMNLSKKIKPKFSQKDKRPEFKYIANMHGDEIVGREILLRFIKDCTENYGIDPRITNLLDKFQIHILVSMNPDGAATGNRFNHNQVDLNRDFPDFSTSDNQDTTTDRQPETQAVMNWQAKHKFKLSANFHGGAEVVNYPWDTAPDRFPEDTLMKELSREYAQNAPYIAASTIFENGITNGFSWYEVNGGMQDWSIYWRSDFQITVELSDDKWPEYSEVDHYYEQNRPALIAFVERIETIIKK
jgi:carboxypeptidase D